MNNNSSLLGQVLGGVFGQAMSRRGIGNGAAGGALGGLGGVALGSVLGGVLGAARRNGSGMPATRQGGGNTHAALLMLLLPLAMRWVQRNGGIGAVLDRFRQQGYGRQTQSWVAPGDNQPLDGPAVEKVVGSGEIAGMAQRLGVPEHEVAQALADIMPQLVDRLTPEGHVPQQADEVLDEGRQTIEREIAHASHGETAPS